MLIRKLWNMWQGIRDIPYRTFSLRSMVVIIFFEFRAFLSLSLSVFSFSRSIFLFLFSLSVSFLFLSLSLTLAHAIMSFSLSPFYIWTRTKKKKLCTFLIRIGTCDNRAFRLCRKASVHKQIRKLYTIRWRRFANKPTRPNKTGVLFNYSSKVH